MKILFVYTNINGFHQDEYSFGLASMVSMTRKAGHDAQVVIVHSKKEYGNCLDELKRFAPRVVGFSSVSSQFSFVKELAQEIKKVLPQTLIVCGGVHPTINPNCVLETSSLDGVFVGESENSFVEFLAKVERGKPYYDTDNFAYAKNGSLIKNQLKPLLKDLDGLPYPDKDVYPYINTVRAVGYAPFFFSRGCPFLCSYCSNHAIAGAYNLPRNQPRYRSVESSIREIEEAVRKFPIHKILIADDIFGLNKEWRRDFCREYQKRIGIKFQCLLRANLVDEEFIQLLKEAGCYRISIGVESGNEYVRNTIMERHMSNEEIINAFDLAHKYHLQTNAINIIGVPGETEEMLWDTIKLNRRVQPTSSGVNIFYPYKGTKLGDYCFKENLVDEQAYEMFSNERRETVLKYPPEYKLKLTYYSRHWEQLVYRYNFKWQLVQGLKKIYRSLKKMIPAK